MREILKDASFMGLRATLGAIFIVHGIGKFGEGFAGFLPVLGLPVEMQIPIALAELIPGILLITGIFTRISASILSIIMLGAIFLAKGAASLIGDGGIELDLILLASLLVIIIEGPKRISLLRFIKLPNYLQ
jgi:putative oxidoreductase